MKNWETKRLTLLHVNKTIYQGIFTRLSELFNHSIA